MVGRNSDIVFNASDRKAAPSTIPIENRIAALESKSYGCMLWDTDPVQTANAVSVVAGTISGGSVTNTRIIDQSYLVVNESAQFDIQFTFTGLEGHPSKCLFTGRYEGNPAHNVWLYIWNYSGAPAWERVTAAAQDFVSSATDYSLSFELPSTADYVSGGESKLRIYHNSAAVGSHNIYVDYIACISETVALPTAGTAVAMTGFTDGPSSDMTIDGAAGTITIDTNGDYSISHYCSFTGKADAVITLDLYVNGYKLVTIFKRKLNSEGDVGNASGGAIRSFVASNVLSYRFWSDTPDSFIAISSMRVTAQKVS